MKNKDNEINIVMDKQNEIITLAKQKAEKKVKKFKWISQNKWIYYLIGAIIPIPGLTIAVFQIEPIWGKIVLLFNHNINETLISIIISMFSFFFSCVANFIIKLFEKLGSKEQEEKLISKYSTEISKKSTYIPNNEGKKNVRTLKKSIVFIIAIAIICISITKFIIPECKYNNAKSLMNEKDYTSAYSEFSELGTYKDSQDKVIEIATKSPQIPFSLSSVGDIVTFGSYEQDGNIENGKEKIEWIILEKQENKVLVISKYVLDLHRYGYDYKKDGSYDYITWKTSALRTWLNNDFMNNAFTTDEQKIIPEVSISNEVSTIDQMQITKDRIFLLSYSETLKYFNSTDGKDLPNFYATDYANKKCLDNYFGEVNWYLLRITGDYPVCGAPVVFRSSDNDIFALQAGAYILDDYYGIRPSLYINI